MTLQPGDRAEQDGGGRAALHGRRLTPRARGWEDGDEGVVCFFSCQSKQVNAVYPRYKLVDDGAFRAEDRRVQGRSRAWAVAAAAALSSEASGRGHLQALLSSTLTARGLMAPVRFTCEAAEGASCSVTAPRLGFSSTRFAC